MFIEGKQKNFQQNYCKNDFDNKIKGEFWKP